MSCATTCSFNVSEETRQALRQYPFYMQPGIRTELLLQRVAFRGGVCVADHPRKIMCFSFLFVVVGIIGMVLAVNTTADPALRDLLLMYGGHDVHPHTKYPFSMGNVDHIERFGYPPRVTPLVASTKDGSPLVESEECFSSLWNLYTAMTSGESGLWSQLCIQPDLANITGTSSGTSKACAVDSIFQVWNYSESLLSQDVNVGSSLATHTYMTWDGMPVPPSFFLASDEAAASEQGVASATMTVLYFHTVQNMEMNRFHLGTNLAQVYLDLESLEKEWLELVAQANEDENGECSFFISTNFEGTEARYTSVFTDVGYTILPVLLNVFFVCGFFFRRNLVASRMELGLMEVAVAILGAFGGYGYVAAMGVYPYEQMTYVPFLVLSLAFDDMFIIVSTFDAYSPLVDVKTRVALTLSETAISTFCSALSTAVPVAFGILCKVQLVSAFCSYTAVTIMLVWAFQFTFFIACLIFESERIRGRNLCICSSVKAKVSHKSEKARSYRADDVSTITSGGNHPLDESAVSSAAILESSVGARLPLDEEDGAPRSVIKSQTAALREGGERPSLVRGARPSVADIPIEKLRQPSLMKSKKRPSQSKIHKKSTDEVRSLMLMAESLPATRRAMVFYNYLLTHTWPRLIVLGAFFVFFVVGIYGLVAFTGSPTALSPVFYPDRLSKSDPEHQLMVVTDALAGPFGARGERLYLVMSGFALCSEDESSGSSGGTSDVLTRMETLVTALGDVEDVWYEGRMGATFWLPEYREWLMSDESGHAGQLDSTTGLPASCQDFYGWLRYEFLATTPYNLRFAGDFVWAGVNESSVITATRARYWLPWQSSNTAFAAQYNQLRQKVFPILQGDTHSGIVVSVNTAFGPLVEGIVETRSFLVIQLIEGPLLCLAVSLLLLIHPGTAVLITCIVLMIQIELYFLIWAVGFSLDPTALIFIIVSVGFSLDYSVHIGHRFMVAEGATRTVRVLDTVRLLAVAVFAGACSSFFSNLAAVFYKENFGQVNATIGLLTVLLSVLHGLLLLPVLLTYIGPRGYVSLFGSKEGPLSDTLWTEEFLATVQLAKGGEGAGTHDGTGKKTHRKQGGAGKKGGNRSSLEPSHTGTANLGRLDTAVTSTVLDGAGTGGGTRTGGRTGGLPDSQRSPLDDKSGRGASGGGVGGGGGGGGGGGEVDVLASSTKGLLPLAEESGSDSTTDKKTAAKAAPPTLLPSNHEDDSSGSSTDSASSSGSSGNKSDV